MPSQEEEATTFSLSFGGVEFCLAPSLTENESASTGDVMCISKICNREVLINLNNFVGTLRVKNVKMDAAADTGVALPTADQSVMGNDDDYGDDNMIVEAPLPPPPPPPVEQIEVVEDTPSPEAKNCTEEVIKPADQRKQQRRGQQKLNFFGRQGKKQGQETETQKASSKRCPANDECVSTKRKKTRKGNKSKQNESPDTAEDTADFNDVIDEPKNESTENEFTLASLGQTMPSQDNESRNDVLSLDFKVDDTIADKDIVISTANAAAANKPVQGTAPCPRWGQTMTMIDHKRFIVYGGQTIENDTAKPLADMFVYDLMEGSWTQPINCDGIARTWHTANFLPERQLLLCFGGEILNENTGKLTTTDQVMVLDCEIMLWYPPTVSGQVPSGRSGHASCVLSQTNELIVFGGVKNGKWLNSISLLDTNRWRWSTLKAAGDAPRPRSYHSATAIGGNGSSETGNRVVIFGGNDGSKCFNSVHVLEATGENKKWVWSNPTCKGSTPSPRTGHNATLLNDSSTILVYGGWDPNTEDENGDDLIFGDSFLLDTKTWTWRKGPKPRYVKTKTNVANGGPHRVGHSAVLAPGKEGVQVLTYAGRTQENKFAGDFQSLIVPL